MSNPQTLSALLGEILILIFGVIMIFGGALIFALFMTAVVLPVVWVMDEFGIYAGVLASATYIAMAWIVPAIWKKVARRGNPCRRPT